MALRFRKSFKLAPGIRWNLSGSGSSWTIGPRGASVGIGKRGTFLNSGLPGTGLSYRSQLSGSSTSPPSLDPPGITRMSMSCTVLDDGTLAFTDASGAPIPEYFVEISKKQNRQALLELIQERCDEINEQIESLGRLHHDTPNPAEPPRFVAPPFTAPRPEPPPEKRITLLGRLIPGRRARIELENKLGTERYQSEVARWEADRVAFHDQVAVRKRLVEDLIYRDTDAMERFLEERLAEITWPRETTVTLEVGTSGRAVALDVDLPEFEDMPDKLAAVPARGLKLSVKELSQTKIQKLYAEHIHGVVFRLVGEAFAALPTVTTVTVAGYSQRRDPATAQLRDDYLVSVRVGRVDWTRLDFAHLASIDAIIALQEFDLRREMSKTGLLKPISPHA